MKSQISILILFLFFASCTKDDDNKYTAPPGNNDNEQNEDENNDSIQQNIPLLYINTNQGNEIYTRSEYVEANAQFDGIGLYEDFLRPIEIRGRGNSTWDLHPKKPYQFKFKYNEQFLGLPANDKWLLLAEYSDKSLIRNRTALKMGEISNLEWTPKSEYIEMYLNDEYNGLYLVTEKVEDSRNRLDIGDDGFLLEVDQDWRLVEEDVYFETNSFLIVIKEPAVETNDEKFKEIEGHIAAFENALYGDNFKDAEKGYQKYIDLNSFIDWYLINEITKNQDTKDFSSIFFHYTPGQKVIMGPIWDYDLAFGNVDYSECENPEGWWVKDHAWYARLFEDDYFVDLVKTRFLYFNNNKDLIITYMEEQAEMLKYAQERNDVRWDLFGNYVWPNPVFFNTHQQEIDHLIEWYEERMDWLEDNISDL